MNLAHRMVAALVYGSCPEGLHVMHACDVRACINPDHLSYGTPAENVAHTWEVGRGVRSLGEACGKSKLSTPQVLEIRRLREAGETQSYIAAVFNVSKGAVAAVLQGRTWSHV